ncbi:MAG: recombinase family protein [Deltaproteobacteria bacterium]|nr:recombinase family protein [Deltaproteobacteria bacterium]
MSEKPTKAPAPMRCAVYTRKSTEEGLDRDFNSLDAQREAGEAYVKSQKHLGWECLPEHYDDGGFTGANMERPALQRLLADIEASKVDVVVVYKVDRLSRSLLDFAKLIEAFDKRGVSFVSVTQQFNTTQSLGRLVLHILLSFAQFEREMIAERTRDKMGAARRKGKGVGGRPPFGYDVAPGGRKLLINPGEAEQVREMFALYEKERSLLRAVETLNGRGRRTKSWTIRKGTKREGGLWGKWSLRKILTSVTYIGKVLYRDEIFQGEHDPIIDPATFARVGEMLRTARRDDGGSRNKHGFLLRGLIRCAKCRSAMVSWASAPRHGRTYRYYTCGKVNRHGRGECSVRSVSADKLEAFVVERIREMGRDAALLEDTVKAVQAGREHDVPALQTEQNRLEHQLAALRGEAKQLVANLGEQTGEGSRAVLERLGEVEQRAMQIELRLAEIKAATAALNAKSLGKEEIANALALFGPAWEGLVPREQANLLHLLIAGIEYDGIAEQVDITWRPAGIAALASDVAAAGAGGRADDDGAGEESAA